MLQRFAAAAATEKRSSSGGCTTHHRLLPRSAAVAGAAAQRSSCRRVVAQHATIFSMLPQFAAQRLGDLKQFMGRTGPGEPEGPGEMGGLGGKVRVSY